MQQAQGSLAGHLGGYFDGGPLAEAMHHLLPLDTAEHHLQDHNPGGFNPGGDNISWPGDLPAVTHPAAQDLATLPHDQEQAWAPASRASGDK